MPTHAEGRALEGERNTGPAEWREMGPPLSTRSITTPRLRLALHGIRFTGLDRVRRVVSVRQAVPETARSACGAGSTAKKTGRRGKLQAGRFNESPPEQFVSNVRPVYPDVAYQATEASPFITGLSKLKGYRFTSDQFPKSLSRLTATWLVRFGRIDPSDSHAGSFAVIVNLNADYSRGYRSGVLTSA